MITNSFDNQTMAIIEPQRKAGVPLIDVMIITFSYIIEEYIKNHFNCTQIATLYSATGLTPVYQIEYKGKKIGFYKTYVGAPCTVGLVEDALSEVDTNKVIMFGGAGCLDKDITFKNSHIVAGFMKQANIPYVLGKTWTTDAIYRETRGNFEKRKQDGCIAVEMECASVQAVCDFRGVEFYNFLKSGDLLDAPEWDSRSELGNNGSQHDPRYFMIALDLACFVSNSHIR